MDQRASACGGALGALSLMFRRKPLDAITQEVMISLADEPDRWSEKKRGPFEIAVWRRSLCRDDGLVVSLRESMRSPWPMYAASVTADEARFEPTGRDLRTIRQAVLRWLHERENGSAGRVRAFLAKTR
jgi:hypothetical protein